MLQFIDTKENEVVVESCLIIEETGIQIGTIDLISKRYYITYGEILGGGEGDEHDSLLSAKKDLVESYNNWLVNQIDELKTFNDSLDQ